MHIPDPVLRPAFESILLRLLPVLICGCLFAGALPAVGQEPPADPEGTDAAPVDRKEERQRAREARIQDYLRQKEERRVRRDVKREEKQAMRAAEEEQQEQVGENAAVSPKKRKEAKRQKANRPAIPRNLERIHKELGRRPLGQDPGVLAYIDLIESGEATAPQLAAFGSFLGQNGMHSEAIEYYAFALEMEPDDPLLWLNVGTLHRQNGEQQAAAAAYGRALSIDGNNAFAHYNLGAVLDEMGRYEDAIFEYRLALTLDPTLGDPAYNPQASNNERLLAVKLMLYKEQAGSLGLPLATVPGGELREGGGPRR